jgi:hypothetical protein
MLKIEMSMKPARHDLVFLVGSASVCDRSVFSNLKIPP